MRKVLGRIFNGEPIAEKPWTVFYYDMSIGSRILKFIFGLHGCHRIDCDDLMFKNFPEGFAVMVNKDADSCDYIWVLQIEKYICNYGYSKIIAAAEDHALEMTRKVIQAQFESQMGGMVQPSEPETPIVKGDMYG